MRNSILIKAISMIVVLGAMVLWSCSQDEEIEEQMEWSKKAVKRSWAKSGLTYSENFGVVVIYQFNPPTHISDKFTHVDASYDVLLTITCDTSGIIPTYNYRASFFNPPFNPGLHNEKVTVSGMEYNGYHSVILEFSADCWFTNKLYSDIKTFTTIIPPFR